MAWCLPNENTELSFEEFVRARRNYWQLGPKPHGEAMPKSQTTSLVHEGNEFILYSAGPPNLFAVFENFDQRGWFYLYDGKQHKILSSAYIYHRPSVAVEEDVIDIGWAADDSACGLAVWGEFRAFLGVTNDVHIERLVTSADEDGIPSSEWLTGFEHYLEPKTD